MKIYVRKIFKWVAKTCGKLQSDFPWLFDSTSWSSSKKDEMENAF